MFRYRIVISSGEKTPSSDQVNKIAKEFAKREWLLESGVPDGKQLIRCLKILTALVYFIFKQRLKATHILRLPLGYLQIRATKVHQRRCLDAYYHNNLEYLLCTILVLPESCLVYYSPSPVGFASKSLRSDLMNLIKEFLSFTSVVDSSWLIIAADFWLKDSY